MKLILLLSLHNKMIFCNQNITMIINKIIIIKNTKIKWIKLLAKEVKKHLKF